MFLFIFVNIQFFGGFKDDIYEDKVVQHSKQKMHKKSWRNLSNKFFKDPGGRLQIRADLGNQCKVQPSGIKTSGFFYLNGNIFNIFNLTFHS